MAVKSGPTFNATNRGLILLETPDGKADAAVALSAPQLPYCSQETG